MNLLFTREKSNFFVEETFSSETMAQGPIIEWYYSLIGQAWNIHDRGSQGERERDPKTQSTGGGWRANGNAIHALPRFRGVTGGATQLIKRLLDASRRQRLSPPADSDRYTDGPSIFPRVLPTVVG